MQDIEANIVVLDMKILDTTQHKDLLGTFISDMVLQLLSYVAENERVNIKQRQAEGIAAAKAKGVRFGRPQTYDVEKYEPIFARVKNNEITPKEAMSEIGCCQSTYYRIKSELKLLNKAV